MTEPSALIGSRAEDPRVALVEVRNCTNSFYLYLYTEVGRQYHWVERRRWSRDRLRAVLDDPNVRIWVLLYDGCPAGYFELARDQEDGVEVAYFGLLPEFLGRGLGRHLLTTAVETAWSLEPRPSRVWLHTCTLDAAQALPNYVARGFVPYKTDEEVIETIDE
jgi:GNAT superfamily N-acetyltransferase